MPSIGNSQFEFNRRELFSSPAEQPLIGNKQEPIQPRPNEQVVETSQVFSNKGIPGEKIGPIVDTGNAGITSVGDLPSSIRGWAGSTFADRANAPLRYDKEGNFVATSATINGRTFTSDPTFGDGSDGDVTIAAGTTTILARDMFYNNLTLSGTVGNVARIINNGYRMFVKNTLTISLYSYIDTGRVHGGNGGNATGATAGTGGTTVTGDTSIGYATNTVFGTIIGNSGSAGGTGGARGTGGSTGGPGGNAATGTAGSAVLSSLLGSGTAGLSGGYAGAGGNGYYSGGMAGAGVSVSGGVATMAVSSIRNIANAILMLDSCNTPRLYNGFATDGACSGGGGGGGGGGGSTTTPGGTGGGGGGAGRNGSLSGGIFISARIIINNGYIQANGGNGGNGGNGADGSAAGGIGTQPAGGGGGGNGGCGGRGGKGGVIVLIYNQLTNTGTIEAKGGNNGTGGAGGVGGAGANGGFAGQDGTAGIGGGTAADGVVYYLPIQ